MYVFLYFVLQMELLVSLGGVDQLDVMLKCLSEQMQWPEMRENFYCSSYDMKAGTTVPDVVKSVTTLPDVHKHNFMATQCSKAIRCMYQNYLVDIKYFWNVRTIKCSKVYQTVTKSFKICLLF